MKLFLILIVLGCGVSQPIAGQGMPLEVQVKTVNPANPALRLPMGNTSRLNEALQRHDYFFIQRSLKAIKDVIDIPNDQTEEMRVMALTNRVEEILIKVERFKDNEFTKALLEFKYELIVDGITPQLKLLYVKMYQIYQDIFQLYKWKLRYLRYVTFANRNHDI